MKILLAHNYYPVIGGGEDSVVGEEREMLEKAGHTVIPFFMYTKERGFLDLVISFLCLIWNPFAYHRIRQTLKVENPDVVHCHNTFPLLSPSIYWACKRGGVPVVQTLHNYRLVCANGLFLREGSVCEDCSGKTFAWPAIRYRCYRKSFSGSVLLVMMQWTHRMMRTWKNKVDRYIALTDFAKSKFVESGVFLEEKVAVKPNFISDPSSGEPLLSKEKRAVFIGRLWPEKGCCLLVEAWINAFDCTAGLNGYELLIIGDGPDRAQAEAMCDSDPEKTGIRFLGTLPRQKVFEILQASRFLALPSICYEGFPMTIIEAFACDVPVISTEQGSMLSIIEDQKTGLFFEPGNVGQLADRIVWAVAHEAEMSAMGQNARLEFEEKYTRQHNYEQLLEIYQSS